MTIKTPFDDLIGEAEFAQMLGVSLRTVMRHRAMRTGPAHIKIGKKIFYRVEAIQEWLLSLETQPLASKFEVRG